jgi:predicted GTPase
MKMENDNGFDKIEKAILETSLEETEKNKILKVLLAYKNRRVNILITGATGCGKSSTINALFSMEKAKVGTGTNPETMQIECFELGNLILWDSPGLGDGKESDIKHSKGIISKLQEKDENNQILIDVVLVILDGSSRDLGTSYELINQVIIPNLGGDTKRIIIGINQADMAMKGKYWDSKNSKPLPPLQAFLDEKAESVKKRIKEGTGVTVSPVCYSAGFKEEGMAQEKPYNLSKLLAYIIANIPEEKRLPVLFETNKNAEVWQSNDDLDDYNKEITKNTGLALLKDAGIGATSGAAVGAAIGSVIPVVGTAIGAAVGAVGGAIIGGAKHVKEFFDDNCFITTATCKTLGKSDDCYELGAFRSFRDNWLVKQPDGQELVAEYYEIAPKIVSIIDKKPQKAGIYRSIWEDHLAKCLADIETGEYAECKKKYTAMVNYLRRKYC